MISVLYAGDWEYYDGPPITYTWDWYADIIQAVLDQGIIGIALIGCIYVIWKLTKKMDDMNTRIIKMVEGDSGLKAQVVDKLESLERELDYLRRD